jgi:catalase
MEAKTKLTSVAGIPVGDNQNSLIAGPCGPGLLSVCNYSS